MAAQRRKETVDRVIAQGEKAGKLDVASVIVCEILYAGRDPRSVPEDWAGVEDLVAKIRITRPLKSNST